MARGIMYVESGPVTPDRLEEYHDWYEQHMARVLGARRLPVRPPVRRARRTTRPSWRCTRSRATTSPRCGPGRRGAEGRSDDAADGAQDRPTADGSVAGADRGALTAVRDDGRPLVRGRQRVAVQPGRVAAGDHRRLLEREIAEARAEQVLGTGPRRIGVGEVGLEHDVVDADQVPLVEGARVVEHAEPEVPAQQLAGAEVEGPRLDRGRSRRVLRHVVETIDRHRHPADAALAQGDLEVGVPTRDAGPDPVHRRAERGAREHRHLRVQPGAGRALQREPAGTAVQRDDRVGLLARPEERRPVLMVGDRRQVEPLGRLEERHRGEPALGVAADLLAGEHRVLEPRQLHRDEPLGMGAVPLLDHPAVPRPDGGQAHLLVAVQRQDPAGEPPRAGREAQRRPHTVDVHVTNALVDVPTGAAHLVEVQGFVGPLRTRSTGDDAEAGVGVEPVLVAPRLAPVGLADDPGSPVPKGCRESRGEHVGRLGQVVVDRDDGERARLGLGVGEQLPCASRCHHVLLGTESVRSLIVLPWRWPRPAEVPSLQVNARSQEVEGASA